MGPIKTEQFTHSYIKDLQVQQYDIVIGSPAVQYER